MILMMSHSQEFLGYLSCVYWAKQVDTLEDERSQSVKHTL
jgi:hypothetical protein